MAPAADQRPQSRRDFVGSAREFIPASSPAPVAVGPSPVVAAIDIGSNSIKMTVARLAPSGALDEFGWASETVRLGAGLDASGQLAADRVEAALATLGRFVDAARARGAHRLVAVATEAVRSAANGPAFLDRVRHETGIEVRVIGGDEEATLTFRGLAASTDIGGDLVVADVGGGSTEVIVAGNGDLRGARSLPLGSGRLTDRLIAADPPTSDELLACRRVAAGTLSSLGTELPLPSGPGVRLLVLGGTGEYLGRLVAAERAITPRAVDGVLARLRRVTAAQLASELGIVEARARVLPAGVAIVAAFADLVRPGAIEVARSGIRAGLLLATFDQMADSG